MAILRRSPSVPRPDPAPAELAVALARLCEREGLDPSETTGVLTVALTWSPGRPSGPTPLLRAFSMTIQPALASSVQARRAMAAA
jgi:hypothetical protein